MKSYTIHLVRHGMTSANLSGEYAGMLDVPLCDEGIEQLKQLREKYDYGKPDIIFSSPLTRCKQTVKLLYGEDAQINEVYDLHEVSVGDYEGKKATDLVNDPNYMAWVRGEVAPPNGESNQDFAKRVCTAFVRVVRDILKSGKTNAVICAHGGVIMTLLGVYGIPRQDSINWMANNGRGFTIRVTPSIWMRTGMVEVVSEYPQGSADEPDLTHNPVKESSKKLGKSMDFGVGEECKITPEDELDFDDSYDFFLADVEEKE